MVNGDPPSEKVPVKPESRRRRMAEMTARLAEQDRLVAKLREEAELYRLLVEYAGEAMALVQDERTVYCNPNHLRLLGYTAAEWADQSFLEVIAPEDRDRVADYHQRRLRGEPAPEIYEMAILTRDGSRRVVEASPRLVTHRGRPAVMGILRDVTRRHEADKVLRQAQERLQAIFQAVPDAISINRLSDGLIILVNQGFTLLTGYSVEEAVGRSALELNLYAEPSDRLALLDRLRREGRAHNFETRLRLKDDRTISVLLSARLVNLDGQDMIIGVIRDIEELKGAREELRASEERYRGAMEASADPFLVYDILGRVTYANPAFTQIFGWSAEEVAGRRLDFVPPEAWAETKRVIDQVYAGQRCFGFESQRLTKSGALIAVSLSAALIRDQDGRPQGLVVNLRDITQAKLAEEALRQSEEKYRTTFQAIPDSIAITKLSDGTYLYVNDAFTALTGWRAEEVLGRKPFDIGLYVDPVDRTRILQMIKDLGHIHNLELQHRRKDGMIIDILFSSRPLRFGDVDCLVSVGQDISAIKQAEAERDRLAAQLQQAQKMEAVGTLAGGVAHDFNNLLQAISGYAQLLAQGPDNHEEWRSYVSQIERSARRGAELVHQLLTFSRKVRPELSPLDPRREILQTVDLLRRTIPKMIALETEFEADLPPILADPIQLEQVLLNLGTNARDAMPQGGRLTIRVSRVALSPAEAEQALGLNPGTYVLLEVADTGQGMSEATLQHAFEPFFTTKGPGRGTGLGLSIVYGIVQAHGGRIFCQSQPGQGATFRLYFPAAQPGPVAPQGEAGPEEDMPGGTETILVVDDEASIRDICRILLGQRGYTVLEVESGEMALEVYRGRLHSIDLILLDLGMPGMGGYRCLEGLLLINPGVKVVVASGYSAESLTEETLRLGAKGFIAKPYRLKEMLQTIRAVLDAPS